MERVSRLPPMKRLLLVAVALAALAATGRFLVPAAGPLTPADLGGSERREAGLGDDAPATLATHGSQGLGTPAPTGVPSTEVAPRRVVTRVLFGPKTPAAGLTVVAVGPGGTEVSAVTDAQGFATLLLPWGEARMMVRRGGGDLYSIPWREPARATDPPGPSPAVGEADVELYVARERVLSLRVTRRGQPVLPVPFRITVGEREIEPAQVSPDLGF